jgi:hypothetical protein
VAAGTGGLSRVCRLRAARRESPYPRGGAGFGERQACLTEKPPGRCRRNERTSLAPWPWRCRCRRPSALGHRAVLRLSWLLVASVALSTLLQVAVAPPTPGRVSNCWRHPGVAAGQPCRAQPAVSRRHQRRSGGDLRRIGAERSPNSADLPPNSAKAHQSGAALQRNGRPTSPPARAEPGQGATP